MTHLTGSTFNLFNKGDIFFKTKTNYLFKYSANNAICWGVTPSAHFDSLNFSASYTKLSKQDSFKEFTFFELYYIFFFKRITFRGKSYRVRYFSKKKKFTLNFNYSHWTKVRMSELFGVSKRKRKKERDRPRYIIYTTERHLMPDFITFFKNIRFYNCYTMRGLRFRSQPIIKRFGKLSQHISILH